MYILGNRKAYIELYDLYLNRDRKTENYLDLYDKVFDNYDYLDDTDASDAWYDHLLSETCYKEVEKDYDKDLVNLLIDTLNLYAKQAKDYPTLSKSQSLEKARLCKTYSDGLIANGGISTDFFKSAFGEERTRDFFDKVFFGTQMYLR